ncbi:MAG: carboxypeptidase-like regulatory domain-containing protein [Bacteroidaceae bacterium]|nr:carboxypeptidase-like regulatory domain-containing protein [Bacteroidaceae bacterium]
MRIKKQILTAVLLCLTIVVQARRVYIYGRVYDEAGQPVELATVNEERTLHSAMTNLKGEYSFTINSRSDTLNLIFRMIGHETRRRTLINPQDTVQLDILLPTLNYTLESVDVNATRRQTNGMQQINAQGLRFTADANGGSVESIIATQAGVSTHNELSSQYNVRGGNFDENSVYVNGTEILRPLLVRAGQQEGLSFINPDMVESIKFSTGGWGVSYGDRMSSVLDITYRKPQGFESVLTASLLGASAYVGAGNDKFSFSGSVRYKTTSYLLGTLDTKGEYDPSFLDYQTYMSWTPNTKWEIGLIGNAAINKYNFTPSDRNTTFGTAKDPKHFKVYYEGWESDRFNTLFGALDVKRKEESSIYRFNLSAFQSHENESFDIISQYWLDEGESGSGLAVGTFMQHARNRLESRVITARISGMHDTEKAGTIGWGAEYRYESVSDRMREWEMRDSAGYTLPYTQTGPMEMIYSLKSVQDLSNRRASAYLEDTYRFRIPAGIITLNAGVRASWWSWNDELTVSPRLMAGFSPESNENLTFRFSTGIYYQTPFYKEIKDTVNTGGVYEVRLNKDIRSQRSIQFVLGGDYDFMALGRPFKFTTEIYYKKLDRLIPYNLDNVRIVYYGENCAHGYAAGIDMKLYGEFVPGTASWLTFSLMNTREKIGGKWLPRPTDQLYNLSLYFTDTFPRRDYWKMSLRCTLADGLPFGPTHSGREKQTFRAPAYKRVDIGLSYKIFDYNKHTHVYGRTGFFKDIWMGVDALNLLGINNVNSYYWITDISNTQFAVPNYLTGRQLNLRLIANVGK